MFLVRSFLVHFKKERWEKLPTSVSLRLKVITEHSHNHWSSTRNSASLLCPKVYSPLRCAGENFLEGARNQTFLSKGEAIEICHCGKKKSICSLVISIWRLTVSWLIFCHTGLCKTFVWVHNNALKMQNVFPLNCFLKIRNTLSHPSSLRFFGFLMVSWLTFPQPLFFLQGLRLSFITIINYLLTELKSDFLKILLWKKEGGHFSVVTLFFLLYFLQKFFWGSQTRHVCDLLLRLKVLKLSAKLWRTTLKFGHWLSLSLFL